MYFLAASLTLPHPPPTMRTPIQHRAAIPLNLEGMVSFNLVFIAKNVVELLGCAMDFAEAGSSALNGGGYQNL